MKFLTMSFCLFLSISSYAGHAQTITYDCKVDPTMNINLQTKNNGKTYSVILVGSRGQTASLLTDATPEVGALDADLYIQWYASFFKDEENASRINEQVKQEQIKKVLSVSGSEHEDGEISFFVFFDKQDKILAKMVIFQATSFVCPKS